MPVGRIVSVLLRHFPITSTRQKILTLNEIWTLAARPDVMCKTPAVFKCSMPPHRKLSQQAQSH